MLPSTELVIATAEAWTGDGAFALTDAQARLRQMVLDAVRSPLTRQSYAKAIQELFRFSAGRPLSRALLQEWKAGMDGLAPSTVNVRLAAVRKLVEEAKRNGLLGTEEAASLSDVPNVQQRGTRLGNWLTKEQAKELLQVPDRETLKGKRDYVILALLVGCAPHRRELASLDIGEIQISSATAELRPGLHTQAADENYRSLMSSQKNSMPS